MTDPIRQPAHYSASRFGFECIDAARHLTFQAGNAFKYIFRHADKAAPLDDMSKALVYWEWVVLHGDPIILPGQEHIDALMKIYFDHLDTPAIDGDPTAQMLGNIIWREVDDALAAITLRIDWITVNGGAV